MSTSIPTTNPVAMDIARPRLAPSPPATTPPPTVPVAKLNPERPWYRRRWVYFATAAAIILLVVAGFLVVRELHPVPKAAKAAVLKTNKPTPTPTPQVFYSPLTGLAAASLSDTQQPVVGVMIENLYPNARPQSGLGAAGIVYEALAEGGITRFLSIFQEPLPVSLGPVRSLRPYYLDWGLEHGIPVAHAGGSQPALAAIKPLGLKDINALVYDGSYFFRTKDRAAPHNLYTNNTLLTQLVAKLGFGTAPTFKPMPRKSDAPETTPTHPVIRINFSTSPYSVQYTFVAANDNYARVMGGVPHIDRNTGAQISVKNIVLEYVPTTYGTQADGKPETDYHLIGSGQAVVFTDGGVTTGTWNKTTDAAPTNLLDATGGSISLNRGNTWYEIVPTGAAVSY